MTLCLLANYGEQSNDRSDIKHSILDFQLNNKLQIKMSFLIHQRGLMPLSFLALEAPSLLVSMLPGMMV